MYWGDFKARPTSVIWTEFVRLFTNVQRRTPHSMWSSPINTNYNELRVTDEYRITRPRLTPVWEILYCTIIYSWWVSELIQNDSTTVLFPCYDPILVLKFVSFCVEKGWLSNIRIHSSFSFFVSFFIERYYTTCTIIIYLSWSLPTMHTSPPSLMVPDTTSSLHPKLYSKLHTHLFSHSRKSFPLF